MVALGMEILFTLFGLFIGFAAFNPSAGAGTGFRAWTIAWYFVTAFISLYVGGWAAARLSASAEPGTGSMHGLVTWGLATIATLAFVSWMAWGSISSAIGLLQTSAMATAGQIGTQQAANAAAQAAPQVGANLSSAVWGMALVTWIGVSIAAFAAWIGGRRGERPLTTARP